MLERLFKLRENNTNARTEVVSGLITFFSMSYILVVNPAVLSAAGIPLDRVFTATIIAILIGTLIMALAANYPIVVAPGMGINSYFATLAAISGYNYKTVSRLGRFLTKMVRRIVGKRHHLGSGLAVITYRHRFLA